MKEKAFSWWNKNIEDEREPFETPEIESVENMAFIWSKISPIIFSNINLLDKGDAYWTNIHKIVKMYFKDDEVPNPLNDFPEFVIFLYKNRDLLHLNSPNTYEKYVEAFYDADKPDDFFLRKLVFAVGEPEKVFSVFSYLQRTKNKKWVDFMQMHGTVERLIDMFISFASQITDGTMPDDCYDYRLDIAEFITDILCEIDHPIVLKEEIMQRFYTRLVKLMKYTKNETSLTFFRCAVRLNNKFFPTTSLDTKVFRIKSILAATTGSERFTHIPAIKYAQQQAGKCISYKRLIAGLMSLGHNSNIDLTVIHDLALESNDIDCIINATRYFGRKMIANKINIRICAFLLSDLVKHSINDKLIIKWFKAFVRGMFGFIYLATLHNKYKIRVHRLCEVFSSSIFDDEKEKKVIISVASALFVLLREMGDFLIPYFPEIDKNVDIYELKATIKKIEKFPYILKFVPYKPNSYTLIEINTNAILEKIRRKSRERMYINHEEEEEHEINWKRNRYSIEYGSDSNEFDDNENLKHMPPLSLEARKYVYIDFEVPSSNQEKHFEYLDTFITEKKDILSKLKNYTHVPKPGDVPKDFFIKLLGLNVMANEYSNIVANNQRNSINKFVAVAEEIMNGMKKQSHLFINAKFLEKNLISDPNTQNGYKTAVKHKIMLKRQIIDYKSVIKMHLDQQPSIKSILSKCTKNFIFKILYSPPGYLEQALQFRFSSNIITVPEYKEAVEAISAKNVPSLVNKVYEVVNSIISKYNLTMDFSSPVITNSVFRIVFDEAYSEESELNIYRNYDEKFIKEVKDLQNKPLNEFSIRKELLKNASKYKTSTDIAEYSSKDLSVLQFLNNPTDIAYQIYLVIQSFSNIFKNVVLTSEESKELILCVISHNPPINPVSIALFLDTFEQTFLSLEMQIAADIYKKAIFSIINIEDLDRI